MFRYYANDEVHLNRSGKRFFVYELVSHWSQLEVIDKFPLATASEYEVETISHNFTRTPLVNTIFSDDSLNHIVNNVSFWDSHCVKRSPGDGHCLLHSVADSCNSHIKLNSPITIEQLKCMILEEVAEHANLYLQFLVDSSHDNLRYHMNQYVFNKMYNTDFGNLVPLVIANVLHVNIGIISEGDHGYCARVIHTSANNDILGNILLYKTPDHYESIILKSVTDNNPEVWDRYHNRIGGSPAGRHLKPESDPPNTCTSGGKSMMRDKTPRTISPDREQMPKSFVEMTLRINPSLVLP